MKFFFLLVLFSLLNFNVSNSQSCQWAEKIGGRGNDLVTNITIDDSANIYVIGKFDSNQVFFNKSITLSNSSNSYTDVFITKYNSNGVCQWAQKIEGTTNEEANSITLDKSGNIYISGHYTSPIISFNDEIKLSNSGTYDIYFAKFNSLGTCLWAQSISGTGIEINAGLELDSEGNIYVGGYFSSSTLNFNNGIFLNNFFWSANECFIAKYNPIGICQWAQKIGGTGDDKLYSMAIDTIGNVYVAGNFASDTLRFNKSRILTNSFKYFTDGFISKYNSAGDCQWAEKIGGNSIDIINCITIDYSGSIFVTGYFGSRPLFFNNAITLSITKGPEAFLAKYNNSGTCLWAQSIAGNGSVAGVSLAKDLFGNIYISGSFNSDTLNFNNIGRIYKNDSIDTFIAMFNSNGYCQWAESISGTKNDLTKKICVDDLGFVYIAGNFNGDKIIFNNEISLSNSIETGTIDSYIAKYKSPPIGIENSNKIRNNISLLPNPNNGIFTLRIEQLSGMEMKMTIINMIGQEVFIDKVITSDEIYSKDYNISGLNSGIYYLKLRFGEDEIVKQIIISK